MVCVIHVFHSGAGFWKDKRVYVRSAGRGESVGSYHNPLTVATGVSRCQYHCHFCLNRFYSDWESTTWKK